MTCAKKKFRRYAVPLALCAAAASAYAQNPAAQLETPTVEVVGTTPLPVLGTPVNQVPANVQAATGADVRTQRTTNLAEFMQQNLTGVNVNEVQNNPFQPDVTFRGFTASPLLGTPQGLSVFQDGVRINEAFGDIVNWDLIPQSAISTINLIPGTNPVFGLNTLGGALSINTKSGFHYPGTSAQAYGGSFGRRAFELETGGHGENMDYFLTGNLFREDGWRDHSPSDVKQLFGKAGWENATSDVDLSYTWADTDLTGNGLLPQTMLEERRESVFTFPDNTQNRLNFVNLAGSHWLNDDLLLAGNVYYRQLKTRTFNGDLNDDYAEDFEACAGDPVCEADLLAENGENNRTSTDQRRYGVNGQVTHLGNLAGRRNRVTLGLSYDDGRSDFLQTEQEAALNAERGTVATEPEEIDTILRGTTRTYSVYVTDTYSLTDVVHLTLSGRYDHTRVELDDRGPTGELDGRHRFSRFNPAVGVNLTPRPERTYYAAYSEGSRAPTPIELGCADPANPCTLPNAMVADPPLDQVVARTWETGVRGKRGNIGWSAALFRTTLDDDIHFIAVTTGGAGFFDNVGRTRREGLELGLNGEHGRIRWWTSYAYVDATYQSPIAVLAADNSTADPTTGIINVQPGDRIPLIPRHVLKLAGEYTVTAAWSVGANVMAVSDHFVRGNENNDHQPDGGQFLGPGKASGYGTVNLNTRYRFAGGWEVFARVHNLFDKEYATSGALAINPFIAAGQFQPDPADWRSETFLAPGAPRAAWVGVRYGLSAGKDGS